jgi:hypothetical protein
VECRKASTKTQSANCAWYKTLRFTTRQLQTPPLDQQRRARTGSGRMVGEVTVCEEQGQSVVGTSSYLGGGSAG